MTRLTQEQKDKLFDYRCICHWSKNNKYGHIPFKNCEVHGKDLKKLLKDTVPYGDD